MPLDSSHYPRRLIYTHLRTITFSFENDLRNDDDDDFEIHRGLSQHAPLSKLAAPSVTGAITLVVIGQRKPFPDAQDQEYALVKSLVMMMMDDDEEGGLIMEVAAAVHLLESSVGANMANNPCA